MILLRDKVNERAKGALTINIVGGPEAIPAFDQPSALKGGVADLGLIPDAYFMKSVPETFALSLTRYNGPQERERGLVNFLQGKYRKANIHYLGRASGAYGFYICTLKHINTVGGLRGIKLPAAPIATPAFKALGMVSIDIEDSEIWAALDRGVVGGTIDPSTLVTTFRWHQRLKYIIDHQFYNLHTSILMNLDSWKKLPGNLQNLLTDAMADVEKEVTPWFDKKDAAAYKEILDAGVKPVKFFRLKLKNLIKWYMGLIGEPQKGG
ncbi:TRAP transporter substrate-binding protein DctP [Thermodesulfobacteriota bacterium]